MIQSPITPHFSGTPTQIRIPRHKQNAKLNFFYNQVSDIIKKQKVPAEISNNGVNIRITDAKYQANVLTGIQKTLKQLGIYFEKADK